MIPVGEKKFVVPCVFFFFFLEEKKKAFPVITLEKPFTLINDLPN